MTYEELYQQLGKLSKKQREAEVMVVNQAFGEIDDIKFQNVEVVKENLYIFNGYGGSLLLDTLEDDEDPTDIEDDIAIKKGTVIINIETL